MPDLFGQQGGQWLPSFRPGNWVSSWGARPNDFGHQTAYSYFQQNPNQMVNYNQGRLGNAFQSWFGGNQQGGPTADPRYPQQPQQPPINPALGDAGGNVGGEYIKPTMVPNSTLFSSMQNPYTPQPPQVPNAGGTQPPRLPMAGFTPQGHLNPQQGIGGFRGRGWF